MNNKGGKSDNEYVTVKIRHRTLKKVKSVKKKYGIEIGAFIDQAVNEKLKNDSLVNTKS